MIAKMTESMTRIKLLPVAVALVLSIFTGCEKGSDINGASDGQEDQSEDSVADVSAENCATHEESADYIWDSSSVMSIVLNGNSITENTAGASTSGSKLTISAAGTYSISGSLTDGQIIVNTTDKATVRLILNGVDIRCSSSAPIYVKSAEKVVVVLAENTSNKLTDGTTYTYDVVADEEPNATIFSKSNLSIYGKGSLTVNANFNDGISTKDGLVINSGNITVTSKDDGIRGKDYLVVKSGTITVNSTGDGLKSDNDSDGSKGYVSIESGTITVTSGTDAISAQTDVLIKDGKFNLTSGGGSGKTVSSTVSAKGIKGTVSVIIDGGTIVVNSADDAIHSNASIAINGGIISLSSGDDGIHSDSTLGLNGGDLTITKSYEGIEGITITVNKGNISVTSSDDGFNATKGLIAGGSESNDGSSLYINGGYVVVTASKGDGLDSNGSIVMTAGTVIVHGPQSQPEVGMDYNGTFDISGGTLVVSGSSSNMTQGPSTSSKQYSLKLMLTSTLSNSTLFHIQDSGGNDILTFKPAQSYSSIVFSSPNLKNGSTYDIYTGGSSTGTLTDGVYSGGTYSGGTKYTSFTISGILTSIGSSSGGGGFNPGGR